MNELKERTIQCPYCGENISVLLDCSVPQQNYSEDCQVCCRPINFDVAVAADGSVDVFVSNENE
jgi:transcription elongation factor Elf1